MRQPRPFVRGAQDGEEARDAAGELQSKGAGKQETHAQRQVEELPWPRDALLDQLIWSPSWKGSPQLPLGSHAGHSVTPQQQLQGSTIQKEEKMLIVLGDKSCRERPAKAVQHKKMWPSGIYPKGVAITKIFPKVSERQPGRDIIFWVFVQWTAEISFPSFISSQLKAFYMPSMVLRRAMATSGNQSPASSDIERKHKLWGKI